MTRPTPHLPFILLAEDEENDIYFMLHAFEQNGFAKCHFVVKDGQQAVDYLSGTGPYHNRQKFPLPTLLLLDLKMPKLDGFDVLRWLARRPDLHALPIVVLSSSHLEADQQLARQLGADDFRTKPSGLQNLVHLVHELCQRWPPGEGKVAPEAPMPTTGSEINHQRTTSPDSLPNG